VRGIRKTAAQIMTDPISRAIVRHNRWITVLLPLFITTALLSYHFSSLFYCRPITATCNHCYCWNYSSVEHCHFFIPRLLPLFIPRLLAFFIPMILALLSPGYWYFSSPFCCPFPSAFKVTVKFHFVTFKLKFSIQQLVFYSKIYKTLITISQSYAAI
jgi:hypothetical protein